MKLDAWFALSDQQRKDYRAAYDREEHRILAGGWSALDDELREDWHRAYDGQIAAGYGDRSASRSAYVAVAHAAAVRVGQRAIGMEVEADG